MCRGLERFVDVLHLHDSEICHPSSSFFNQRNDPEHVVTAPELPCSWKLIRGRQDPENNERGSEPACTQVTGAYRNTSPSMVHLSEVNPRTRETRTRVYTKKQVPMPERNWITSPAVHSYISDSLSSNISKMVMRMVRHHDQDERERDGAVRWDTFYPPQWKEFEGKIGRRCTHEEWIDEIHESSNKTRFEYCLNSRKEFLFIIERLRDTQVVQPSNWN